MRPGAALSLLGEKGGGDKSFYNNAVRDGDWLVFPRAWRKFNEMGGAKITLGNESLAAGIQFDVGWGGFLFRV